MFLKQLTSTEGIVFSGLLIKVCLVKYLELNAENENGTNLAAVYFKKYRPG